MRHVAPLVAGVLLAAGCGSPQSAPTSDPATSTAAARAPAPEPATAAAPPPAVLTQAAQPVAGPPAASLWSVVLVPPGDTLRLRASPSPSARELGAIPPGASEVVATGRADRVRGSTWFEVDWRSRRGWVNAHYLTPDIDDRRFAADHRVEDTLGQLREIVAARGDLRQVTSRKGLAAHIYAPVHVYPRQQLGALMRDDSYGLFGGVECAPGEEGCSYSFPGFAANCMEIFRDPGREIARNRTLDESRPTGLKGPYQVPVEMRGYDFLVAKVEDQDGRISACYLYFGYEQDRPVLTGVGADATGL